MNNKGFTLVELIAIVLILAAIFMVSFPMLLNSAKKNKDAEYDAMVKDICLAGETYIYSNVDSFPDISIVGNTIKINVVNLIRYGNVKSNIMNSKTGGSVKQDAVYYTVLEDSTLKCEYKENLAQYVDNSGANVPELSGMTPVIYKDDSWEVADVTEKWYDYENYEWANAVILTDSGKNKQEGDKLNLETDVKAMFVWIPRYEYKIDGQYGKGGTSPTDPGEIEINFINRKSKNSTKGYTVHPAFTFGEDELTGIWVGKFETSTYKNSACYTSASLDNCNNDDQDPYILPNVKSLIWQNVSNQFATAKKFNTLVTNADSHMMKNREWGAVAYLSQSKYGKYGNPNYFGANKEVYQNKSSIFITGSSNGTPSQSATNSQYAYDVELNGTGASTTGTIYGIYDMSGGAWEYVMCNYNDLPSGGFDATWFVNNRKYYDKYTITSANLCTDEECKGHALNETEGWYGDYAIFVDSMRIWFGRGGVCNTSTSTGVFGFRYGIGGGDNLSSFRTVLAPSVNTN